MSNIYFREHELSVLGKSEQSLYEDNRLWPLFPFPRFTYPLEDLEACQSVLEKLTMENQFLGQRASISMQHRIIEASKDGEYKKAAILSYVSVLFTKGTQKSEEDKKKSIIFLREVYRAAKDRSIANGVLVGGLWYTGFLCATLKDIEGKESYSKFSRRAAEFIYGIEDDIQEIMKHVDFPDNCSCVIAVGVGDTHVDMELLKTSNHAHAHLIVSKLTGDTANKVGSIRVSQKIFHQRTKQLDYEWMKAGLIHPLSMGPRAFNTQVARWAKGG